MPARCPGHAPPWARVCARGVPLLSTALSVLNRCPGRRVPGERRSTLRGRVRGGGHIGYIRVSVAFVSLSERSLRDLGA